MQVLSWDSVLFDIDFCLVEDGEYDFVDAVLCEFFKGPLCGNGRHAR